MYSPGDLTRSGYFVAGEHAVIATSLLVFAGMSLSNRPGRALIVSLSAFLIMSGVLYQITGVRIFMIIDAVFSAVVMSSLPFFIVRLFDGFPTLSETLQTRLEGRHLGDLRLTAQLDLLEKRLRSMSERSSAGSVASQEYKQTISDVLSSVDELRNEIKSRSGQAG